jgi:peptidoglycan/LPS O-acetylase OafA/YrhL
VLVLDGLRLVSALTVVAYHLTAGVASPLAWGVPDQFPALRGPASSGWLGVEMFFLISGFVICMSSWGRTVGEFAVSRVVRLVPALAICIVLTTAVTVAVPTYQHSLPIVDTLANLTMLPSLFGVSYVDPSYWTLTTELLFYVLFAIVVVARGVTYRRVVAFCVGWLLVSLLAEGLGNPYLFLFFGNRYAQYFIAGTAFYLMYRFGPTLLLWGIIGFSWLLSLVRLKSEITRYSSNYQVAVVVVTVCYLLMTLIALGATDRVRWRWLTTAGALTYPLYLLHQVIGLTVIKVLHPYLNPWATLGLTVAGLMLLAYLVHRLWERPVAKRLKQALTRSLHSMRAAGAAVPPGRHALAGGAVTESAHQPADA